MRVTCAVDADHAHGDAPGEAAVDIEDRLHGAIIFRYTLEYEFSGR